MNEPRDIPRPVFSVIVPTCNRPVLLARCLDRLAPGAQTDMTARYEVIVTDDGAENSSRDVIAARYPWVRWNRGPRRGPAANRNAGATHARADTLVFLDDDCIPDPDWLAGFLPALDAGWQVSPGRVVSREPSDSPLDFAPLNEHGNVIWSCNMFVRREALLAIGGFDERFPSAHMEDVDFHTRALRRGFSIGFSRGAVVDHPPRRLSSGHVLGEMHYSEVLYALLHKSPFSLALTLRRITAARLKALAAHPLSSDSLRAVWSLAVELAWVLARWPAWRVRAVRAVRAGGP